MGAIWKPNVSSFSAGAQFTNRRCALIKTLSKTLQQMTCFCNECTEPGGPWGTPITGKLSASFPSKQTARIKPYFEVRWQGSSQTCLRRYGPHYASATTLRRRKPRATRVPLTRKWAFVLRRNRGVSECESGAADEPSSSECRQDDFISSSSRSRSNGSHLRLCAVRRPPVPHFRVRPEAATCWFQPLKRLSPTEG